MGGAVIIVAPKQSAIEPGRNFRIFMEPLLYLSGGYKWFFTINSLFPQVIFKYREEMKKPRRRDIDGALSSIWRLAVIRTSSCLLNLHKELNVRLCALHLLKEKLKRSLWLECVKNAAELPNDIELFRSHQDLFLTSRR